MATDIQQLVDSVKLASGASSPEQMQLEQFNRAYEDMQAGKYESAISAYTELLASSGPAYELTCITNLIKCLVHIKAYAQAEQYYLQLKSSYGKEIASQAEVQEACQLMERQLAEYQIDQRKADQYQALRAGIYEQGVKDPADLDLELKLVTLDFQFNFYRQAFDRVLDIIELEGTLGGKGYGAFREMVDCLGVEDDYVKVARKKFERIRVQMQK